MCYSFILSCSFSRHINGNLGSRLCRTISRCDQPACWHITNDEIVSRSGGEWARKCGSISAAKRRKAKWKRPHFKQFINEAIDEIMFPLRLRVTSGLQLFLAMGIVHFGIFTLFAFVHLIFVTYNTDIYLAIETSCSFEFSFCFSPIHSFFFLFFCFCSSSCAHRSHFSDFYFTFVHTDLAEEEKTTK